MQSATSARTSWSNQSRGSQWRASIWRSSHTAP